MLFGKMLQKNGANENNNSLGYYFRKNPYSVLVPTQKWNLLCFYMRSIVIGLWTIVKWSCTFLWTTVNHAKTNVINLKQLPIEYYGGLHDKPPPCLVDNQCGLQSYVKLKVTTCCQCLLTKWNNCLIISGC